MLEEIRRQQELQKANILRGFGINPENEESLEFAKGEVEYDDELEKAVYADTAENRKLGRVGQEYHRGKGKKGENEDKQKKKLEITKEKINNLKNIPNLKLGLIERSDLNINGDVIQFALEGDKKKSTTTLRKINKELGTNFSLEDFEKIRMFDTTQFGGYLDLRDGKMYDSFTEVIHQRGRVKRK